MLIIMLICAIVFSTWFCTPLYTGLTADFSEFVEIYPNRYKQLVVIVLHGPMVIVVFGGCWMYYYLFLTMFETMPIKKFRTAGNMPFKRFRGWLKK